MEPYRTDPQLARPRPVVLTWSRCSGCGHIALEHWQFVDQTPDPKRTDEHVGSTSVPGLGAKPRIDMLLCRDWLRAHEPDRQLYEQTKRERFRVKSTVALRQGWWTRRCHATSDVDGRGSLGGSGGEGRRRVAVLGCCTYP